MAATARNMAAAPCELIAMAPELLLDELFPPESELLLEGLMLLLLLLGECDPGDEGVRELGGVLRGDEDGDEDRETGREGKAELDTEELELLFPASPTILPVPQGILSPFG